MIVAAISGGPDSVYLLRKLAFGQKETQIVVGHVNYGARGLESRKDQKFVEDLGKSYGMETKVLDLGGGESSGRRPEGGRDFPAGFEWKARDIRRDFLARLSREIGAGNIAMAHTADDQVETILMRVFEGTGIAGLKGIPRETEDGIVRPILYVWKEDILKYLKKHKIPFRTDKSNFDLRFERNWIRHVLIPLLVKRYGKSVKKRIFTLGERFREIDDYLEAEAKAWIRRNVKATDEGGRQEKIVGNVPAKGYEESPRFTRSAFSRLPAVLRVKILQIICFDHLGVAPNERLLASMDRVIHEGGPSAKVKVGKGWELKNRYGEAAFFPAGEGRKGGRIAGKTPASLPGMATWTETDILMEEKGKITPAQARRAAAAGRSEYFDAAGIRIPISVRPLWAGDRIRPFGLDSEKKVKEILIDRKVPRDERWGRPVVCDAEGTILWIPGVLRSAHAPVTAQTRKTILLRWKPERPRARKPSPPTRTRSPK